MGHIRKKDGWRLYLPAVIGLKWPPLILAAGGVGLILLGCAAGNGELGTMLVFPLIFFGLASLSNADIGDRYLLPVYPFILLACAGLWAGIRRWPLAVPVLATIVVSQAAGCLRCAPDYLSYFTRFVRPANAHELLTDGNLDWCPRADRPSSLTTGSSERDDLTRVFWQR